MHLPSTSITFKKSKSHPSCTPLSLSTSLSKGYKLQEKLHSSPRLSSSFVSSSRKKSLRPQQDDMTGGDGDVSPPAPPHAGSASSSDVGRSMKRKPALPGGSSVTTLGSSLPPSKRLKGRGVRAKGGLKKTKKTQPVAPNTFPCPICKATFGSQYAVNGHMRIHPRKERSETEAPSKKILPKWDLNKVPEDDDEEGA